MFFYNNKDSKYFLYLLVLNNYEIIHNVMVISLPFYISNFLSWFVLNKAARHRLRGYVNCFLYTPMMKRFIKNTFGEETKNIQFIRQNTPSRCVCVINDKYFIKIFKKNLKNRLGNFEFLTNCVAKKLSVNVPHVYIAKNNHMYVTKKIPGFGIYEFDKEIVLKNEKKILAQVDNIISQLQSIDVRKIPSAERFCVALESTTKDIETEPLTKDSVLAHFDLNIRNFLFDEKLNICGLIDFDSMAVTNDKNKDKEIFMKYWERYKKSKRKHPH